MRAERGGRWWWRAAAALALACAVPCHAQIEVRDDRGVAVRLPAPPQRIVTLLPSLTETVCALDACARIVGTDRFSDWPASVRALPKAGGLEDANLERIVALRPDLVLAASSARVLDRLEALGVKVAALEPKNHADMRRVLDAVARLLGRPNADALWARIERETQAAAARVPAGWRGKRVYFEVDAGPYAAGPASFIGETMQRLGLGNIVPAALGPFPKLNPEFVVRADPDLIVGSRREVDEMAARPGWSAMRALRDGQVCRFDNGRAEVLVRPGPRLGEAAALLADCLMRLKEPR
jgi:iron complex transport system substrate-binding protein